jgi:hypothetical protein
MHSPFFRCIRVSVHFPSTPSQVWGRCSQLAIPRVLCFITDLQRVVTPVPAEIEHPVLLCRRSASSRSECTDASRMHAAGQCSRENRNAMQQCINADSGHAYAYGIRDFKATWSYLPSSLVGRRVERRTTGPANNEAFCIPPSIPTCTFNQIKVICTHTTVRPVQATQGRPARPKSRSASSALSPTALVEQEPSA